MNISASDKTLYINAKIYDGHQMHPGNAFLVEVGRFLEVGEGEELEALTNDCAVVDLQGRLVMPGFIESHAHLLSFGQSRMSIDLRSLAKKDIIAKVFEQASRRSGWIRGRGWDQNIWPDKEFPHQKDLDGIENPVFLKRVDGHAGWFNQKALAIAGIDENTPDPEGGLIVRDKDGKPTGVFIDNAIELVARHINKSTPEELSEQLDLAIAEALSRGITSFHDAGANRDELELFKRYQKEGKLKLRIYAMVDGTDEKLVEDYLAEGPFKNDFLTIRSIKYFADGALGSRGAALLQNYADDPCNSGLLLTSEEDLLKKSKEALKKGFQVCTHAIGDKANQMVLLAYEQALRETLVKDARLRVEHAQLVDPQDHHRFKEHGIIASMQPIHCTSDMPWVNSRLGDRVSQRAYPWKSLLKAGAVLAFGSDSPVEEINPLKGIYAAVSRTKEKGGESFMPEERLTLKEAFNAYFLGGAFAEFNEHLKGQIKAGFMADFVVYDVDILHPEKSSFLNARPAMTVVNGQEVYRR